MCRNTATFLRNSTQYTGLVYWPAHTVRRGVGSNFLLPIKKDFVAATFSLNSLIKQIRFLYPLKLEEQNFGHKNSILKSNWWFCFPVDEQVPRCRSPGEWALAKRIILLLLRIGNPHSANIKESSAQIWSTNGSLLQIGSPNAFLSFESVLDDICSWV